MGTSSTPYVCGIAAALARIFRDLVGGGSAGRSGPVWG